jgi:hypothetical protein
MRREVSCALALIALFGPHRCRYRLVRFTCVPQRRCDLRYASVTTARLWSSPKTIR